MSGKIETKVTNTYDTRSTKRVRFWTKTVQQVLIVLFYAVTSLFI